MPIPINLKQILQSDTQQERLDKINYNFDQLVANGGGPAGLTGSIGETGAQGVTGDQGPQGIQGPQGPQGPADESNEARWKDAGTWSNGNLNIKTIVPIHDNVTTNYNPATAVMIGFANNDPEYHDPSGLAINSSLLVNKNSNYSSSNIRLITEKNIEQFFDINLTTDNNTSYSTVEFKFNSTGGGGEFHYLADKFTIEDLTGNEMMSMDYSNGVVFTGSFLSSSSAEFVGSIFRINNGSGASTDPADGKIAVSLDSQGTIGFKTPGEIGAGIPIGTIVSFLEDIYNDANNFEISQNLSDLAIEPDQIDITIGRGVAGTDYEGWYLCNGQTWKNGTVSYTVPNLNSFQFNLSTNTGSLSSLPSDGTPNVIGGGEISLNQNGSAITTNIDTATTNVWLETASDENHDLYRIIKNPQLIYLGATDLYYNVTAPPPLQFTLQYEQLLPPNTPYGGVTMPNTSAGLNPDRWSYINSAGILRPLSGKQVKGTDGTFNTNNQVELNIGQNNVYTLKLIARGKDTTPAQIYNPLSLPERNSYAWFTDWSERFDGSANALSGATQTWNDRGEYSSNTTYNTGDVFHYNNVWYTLASGITSVNTANAGYDGAGVADNSAISNPSLYMVQTGSSWETGGNINQGYAGYFYQLPQVQGAPETWYYWSPNSTQISWAPPSNNRESLTPGYGQGVSNVWSSTNLVDESNNPVYPPLFEKTDNSKPYYDREGRWTWPAECFLDIDDSYGNTLSMIQLPVVSRYNYNAMNNDLNTSFTSADWPQYSNNYTYTEGNDWWGTDMGPTQLTSGQYGPVSMAYNGGWDHDAASNVIDEWDYWYLGQHDTEFRRYKTVEFKVLLDAATSNQVHNYLTSNPGSTIKIRAAWFNDKIELNSLEDNVNINDPHSDPNVSTNFLSGAWNKQPIGNAYDAGGGGSNNTNPPAYSLTGTGNFNIDDYLLGEGNGSDTVYYTINPTSSTPVVQSSPNWVNVTVNSPNSNGQGSIDITSNMSCSNNPTGFTGNIVIKHPNDATITHTYNGTGQQEQCNLSTLAVEHNITNNNNYPVNVTYTNSSGGPATVYVPQNSSISQVCGVPGTFNTPSGVTAMSTQNLCI